MENIKKFTPSYEACMRAYQHILPTIIELAKKDVKKECSNAS